MRFPSRFIESVIRDFKRVPDPDEEDIVPSWLFDDRHVLTVRLHFCPKNEEISKRLFHRYHILYTIYIIYDIYGLFTDWKYSHNRNS